MRKKGRKNKKYSPEFKISVIMDMREHHLSYGETMRKYFPHLAPRGIGFLKQWERIYLEEGKVGFYIEKRGRATKMDNPKKGRPRKKPLNKQVENDLITELQKLKEENQYLRAENEYIKKLSALSYRKTFEESRHIFLKRCIITPFHKKVHKKFAKNS